MTAAHRPDRGVTVTAPAYIQHIANGLRQERGMTTSRAIAVAVGAMKRRARGGRNVDATTRAAARKALAEWEAGKAKARRISREAEGELGRAALVHRARRRPPHTVARAIHRRVCRWDCVASVHAGAG
jgi:hypothetical protein